VIAGQAKYRNNQRNDRLSVGQDANYCDSGNTNANGTASADAGEKCFN
jgi:hypothetical protein